MRDLHDVKSCAVEVIVRGDRNFDPSAWHGDIEAFMRRACMGWLAARIRVHLKTMITGLARWLASRRAA